VYEDIGFMKKGKAPNLLSKTVVSTIQRGLIGCGHPGVAGGIDQTNEIVLQLQDKV